MRDRGRGSIEKRAGGYRARYSMGYLPSGNPRRLSATFKTKAEAINWLAQVRLEDNEGKLAPPHRVTVAEWCKHWLKSDAGWAPKTLHSYTWVAEKLIIPHLGSIQLQKLSYVHVDNWVTALLRERPASTVVRGLRYLRICLNAARMARLIRVNPSEDIKAPRIRRKQAPVWSPQEATRFLTWARENSPEMADYVHLALVTGARRSELWGLQAGDVRDGGVQIERGVTYVDGSARVGEPKTGARFVPLDEDSYQLAQRLAQKGGWLFAASRGGPVNESRFMARFKQDCRAAGVTPIRLSDLRATWATLTEGMAPAVWLANRAGHSAHTRAMYYVRPSLRESVAATFSLGQILGQSEKTQVENTR
jgi:integrase